jgi:dipeptidyl aminopeptidase/acylaminoacyl peptidase
MRSLPLSTLALSLIALCLAAACERGPQTISRDALFAAPARYQFRLSPDGTQMSFLAPVAGVLNIWVGRRGDFASAHALTHDQESGIYEHMWAMTGRTILYRTDRTGNQNWHIFALDLASGRQRDLTPFAGIQASTLALSDTHPNEILITMNRRDPRFADVYLANIETGALKLVEQNNGFSSFVADNDLNLRFATATTPIGGIAIFEKTGEVWKRTGEVPPDDALTFRFLDFDNTNRRVYIIDSRGRDTAALTRYTPSTGETEILGQGDKADISKVLVHPVLHTVQAFTINYERPNWKVIDPSIEDDLTTLSGAVGPDGEFEIVDRARDDSTWVVHMDKVTEPGSYYLYDTKTRALKFLFITRPPLKGAPLVPMHTALIKARDGLDLVAYYSLPPKADRNVDGKPERKSPLVLVVHGGPWARDQYGFDEWHQWLANRGYAVLSVNFRGSTGFGKGFINAANRQWGEAMLRDLGDAAQWAVDAGIADPKNIAIIGGHYGGYAALAGLAYAPKQYACAISVGGPSNLITLMRGLPPYWTTMRDILLQRVGDPGTEAGLELLRAQSPGLHASAITHPLLIVQGANDPEVSEDDTLSLVHTLKKGGVPVTYVLYPDEGGTLTRPANQLAFYAMAESFLGKCLGGTVEPIGGALKGSSAQVVDGADQIPGLVKAMAAAGSSPASP